jgi:hypothetical protein
MAIYILTWNPVLYPWNERDDEAMEVSRRGVHAGDWTCGATKRIVPGDRVFLLRQGEGDPGIVASGYATETPAWEESWQAHLVKIDWDVILPSRTKSLSREVLLDRVPIRARWAQRSSGQNPHDPLCSRPRSGPRACSGTCVAGRLEMVWKEYCESIDYRKLVTST